MLEDTNSLDAPQLKYLQGVSQQKIAARLWYLEEEKRETAKQWTHEQRPVQRPAPSSSLLR